MNYDFIRAIGMLVGLIAVGVVALAASGVMAIQTVLVMVLPSMAVFGGVSFWIGMKHGEYRVRR